MTDTNTKRKHIAFETVVLVFALALTCAALFAQPAFADPEASDPAGQTVLDTSGDDAASGRLTKTPDGRTIYYVKPYFERYGEKATRSDGSEIGTQASANYDGARRAIVAGLENFVEEIDLESFQIPEDEIMDVYDQVVHENPQFFYVSGAISYWTSWDDFNIVSAICPDYIIDPVNDKDTILEMRKEYDAGLEDLLSWVPANTSNVNKVKAVHDWLVLNCSYNEDAAYYGPYEYGYDPWNAYGALVNRKPVCEGYALAFIAAMKALGFEATYVSDDSHAWNRVCVDGRWYNVDVTFDDPVMIGYYDTDEQFDPYTTYFMKSDKWFIAEAEGGTHSWWEPEGIAATDTTYDEYYDWPVYRGPATNPTPAPEPDPTPGPDPTPTPGPEPDPEPGPTPEPEPEPEPTPTPDPGPKPEPTPDPEPSPEPEPTPTPDPAHNATVERLWGQNALETMLKIVDEGTFEKGGTVMVATKDDYYDALTAAGYAGLADAPVLLTDPKSLSAQTRAQIKKLAPSRIVICGGKVAVSQNVQDELEKLAPEVERAWGPNAIGTANDIARKAVKATGKPYAGAAFVATAGGFWDALAAAPVAYALGYPVFLANFDGTLDPSTLKTMKDLGIKTVYIAGGYGALPDTIELQVEKAGMTVGDRFKGNNACDTSQLIAAFGVSKGLSADKMGSATRDGYWDALCGAALCGHNGSVLVLVAPDDLTAVRGFVKTNAKSISTCYIFGGRAVVPDSVENALKATLGILATQADASADSMLRAA